MHIDITECFYFPLSCSFFSALFQRSPDIKNISLGLPEEICSKKPCSVISGLAVFPDLVLVSIFLILSHTWLLFPPCLVGTRKRLHYASSAAGHDGKRRIRTCRRLGVLANCQGRSSCFTSWREHFVLRVPWYWVEEEQYYEPTSSGHCVISIHRGHQMGVRCLCYPIAMAIRHQSSGEIYTCIILVHYEKYKPCLVLPECRN